MPTNADVQAKINGIESIIDWALSQNLTESPLVDQLLQVKNSLAEIETSDTAGPSDQYPFKMTRAEELAGFVAGAVPNPFATYGSAVTGLKNPPLAMAAVRDLGGGLRAVKTSTPSFELRYTIFNADKPEPGVPLYTSLEDLRRAYSGAFQKRRLTARRDARPSPLGTRRPRSVLAVPGLFHGQPKSPPSSSLSPSASDAPSADN
jgi:hypothetical protein